MITESFINSCFKLLLNKNSIVKRSKGLYRDVMEVLLFSETRDTYEIPLMVKNKMNCLKKILSLLSEGKSIDSVIDSVTYSEKFREFVDFMDTKINEDARDEDFQDIVGQIRLRQKVSTLFKNYDELNNVLESIKDGSFEAMDDMVEDYEVTIKKLYANMMESNRDISIQAAASLDLTKDSYDPVMEMIIKKYKATNKTSSGFEYLDKNVFYGGYEPSRLYVWAGGSGAGKSTMLNNTIILSANGLGLRDLKEVQTNDDIEKVYIYVSLENTIEESLMRTYQPLFNVRTTEFLEQVAASGQTVEKRIKDHLWSRGATIVMKYFPAMSLSCVDLMGIVDEVISEYGKEKIAGLYVDYIDLLKTDTRYDLYRIELGHITLGLKTLAVQYNIPVITGTQLTRDVYKITESKDLNIAQMSESIKKVEHADFVAMLAKDRNIEGLVHGMVGKNRSGKSNMSLTFKVDFERFKFLDVGEGKASGSNGDEEKKSSSQKFFAGTGIMEA